MYTLDISKRLAKHNRQKSLCHSLICTGVFCVSIIRIIYESIVIILSYWTFASFAPHALKGQKLLAQGNALGNYGRNPVAL